MIMVDWLSIIVPYEGEEIGDGRTIVIDDSGELADMDGEADVLSDTELELLRMYDGVNTINIRS